MKNPRATIEFLQNFRKFGWEARYILAKNLFESLQRTEDVNEKKILNVEILSILIAATEDLEAWFAFLRDRQKVEYDLWPFLMDYNSKPKTQARFLEEINGIKDLEGFLAFFGINKGILSAANGVSSEEAGDIIEKHILKALKLAAHNRTAKNRLLVRFHNKVKHHFLVLNSNNPDHGVIVRDGNDILAVPMDLKDVSSALETIRFICYGTSGIISILMFEVANMLSVEPLSLEDKKYFLDKKLLGVDDPVKYLKRIVKQS